MRHLVMVLSVAAVAALAGCTPTTAPASSTTAPATTAPAQGLREVWVPADIPIDSSYYPEDAVISVFRSVEGCMALVVFSDSGTSKPVSEENCVAEPGGLGTPSQAVPLQPGLTMYGYAIVEAGCERDCLNVGRGPAVLRIRW
jgi:hypothetical protein